MEYSGETGYISVYVIESHSKFFLQESQFNYDPLADPSDINHDVLFREGQTSKGEVTFTPRVLIVDLKGSFTNFPQEGDLYAGASGTSIDQLKRDVLWDLSKVEVVTKKEETSKTNKYQKDLTEGQDVNMESKEYRFSDTVTEWSDFMYSKHHPRSVNIVKEYQHEIGETAFDTFAAGVELWKQTDFEDDFGDKIRNMIEECDFCQGFQVGKNLK